MCFQILSWLLMASHVTILQPSLHLVAASFSAEFDVVGSAADMPASIAGSLQGAGASSSGIATATKAAHPTKQL